ncbi:MAG: peroxiredoxin [Nitrosomonas sp.]|nr:peroxiredoxin [Nitrosomonas sp.]MCW5606604.1 peroxiredoxin [Nitrosomonas sp.]
MLEMNNPVADFQLPATGGKVFSLSQMRGKHVVIYFYPKDDTPGCTTEGENFRDNYSAFERLNCVIIGISRDRIKSHENFKAKMEFSFDLLSDEDEIVCQQFDVIRMKNMYGKQVRGIERSTFLIDADGNLRREWRGVKVPGHVDEVLEFVKTL